MIGVWTIVGHRNNGCGVRGRTTTHASKKASEKVPEKVLEKVLGKGFQKGS